MSCKLDANRSPRDNRESTIISTGAIINGKVNWLRMFYSSNVIANAKFKDISYQKLHRICII